VRPKGATLRGEKRSFGNERLRGEDQSLRASKRKKGEVANRASSLFPRQRIRSRIIAGARRHFFSRGFRGVTLDELATELGMSKKTFYRYFANKDALLGAVLEEKFQSVDHDLAAATADCGKDFSASIHRLLDCVQQHTAELQPAFVRDVQRSAPEIFEKVRVRRQEIIQRHFNKLLAAGQKVGRIRADIPLRVAIEILLATTQAIINPQKVLELKLTPEKAFRAVISVFLDGMRTAKGKRGR
jgi:AcrR family transcriptional regulator